MDQTPDEDASLAEVAQSGREQRIGSSIWWVMAAALVALFLGLFVLTTHKNAPAERNTAPVAGIVGMVVGAHTAA